MPQTTLPFHFEFEFNGEIIPVNGQFLPASKDERSGTFAYQSFHPTFTKVFQSSSILRAYEVIAGFHNETEKLMFTYKLCMASYQKFRNIS